MNEHQPLRDLLRIAQSGGDRAMYIILRNRAVKDGNVASQEHAETMLASLADPLDVLRANKELVDRLVGSRWMDVREARETGHSWEEIAETLQMGTKDLVASYAVAIEAQERYVPSHDAPRARAVLPEL